MAINKNIGVSEYMRVYYMRIILKISPTAKIRGWLMILMMWLRRLR